MRVFIAQLLTETNTFVGTPTRLADFEAYGIYVGDGSTRASTTVGNFMAEVRTLAERDGHSVVESLCASAQPSGRTERLAYEGLRDQILADLLGRGPIDAVVIHLHGAMCAEGFDDCEGDLLAAIRAIVGDRVPVAVELDLHCHLTRLMVASSTVIAAYQEYPHTDILSRARHVYDLAIRSAMGAVKPVTAVFDCRMVGLWHTTSAPMGAFLEEMRDVEREAGILSVSLGHGFPWGDVPEAGAKLWVVADGDVELAKSVAARLGQRFWDLREMTKPRIATPEEALDAVLASPSRRYVLADVADNAGGGAPGDSTFLLSAMMDRGIDNAAIGMFWDPESIELCIAAGVGATLEFDLGGKYGPPSGTPLRIRGIVKAIVRDHCQDALDALEPLGTGVWIETGAGIDIALSSVRSQVFTPSAFTGLGITLDRKRLIVVKSTQHFHAGFAPIADAIVYVSTPGALRQDFASIPYVRRDLAYWPRLSHPHAP